MDGFIPIEDPSNMTPYQERMVLDHHFPYFQTRKWRALHRLIPWWVRRKEAAALRQWREDALERAAAINRIKIHITDEMRAELAEQIRQAISEDIRQGTTHQRPQTLIPQLQQELLEQRNLRERDHVAHQRLEEWTAEVEGLVTTLEALIRELSQEEAAKERELKEAKKQRDERELATLIQQWEENYGRQPQPWVWLLILTCTANILLQMMP
ncbi:hypothetical protein F4808DRAFT_457175 [Astrocystis sublimbata]|nr:hypothetical protein F4808DRAFT_457175 [Astrocystis sublimbata]